MFSKLSWTCQWTPYQSVCILLNVLSLKNWEVGTFFFGMKYFLFWSVVRMVYFLSPSLQLFRYCFVKVCAGNVFGTKWHFHFWGIRHFFIVCYLMCVTVKNVLNESYWTLNRIKFYALFSVNHFSIIPKFIRIDCVIREMIHTDWKADRHDCHVISSLCVFVCFIQRMHEKWLREFQNS